MRSNVLEPRLLLLEREEAEKKVVDRDDQRRSNAAYARQGDWFFLKQWTLVVDESDVLRNEPLGRECGEDHVLEFAHRRGGEIVYVNETHPTGISETVFDLLPPSEVRNGRWRRLARDPELYAKGAVRHPDHDTIVLHGWHRVL